MTKPHPEENVRQLVGLAGDYENSAVALSEEVVWIGRAIAGTPSTSTHLLFEDPSVSRVHGAFAWVPQYNSYAFHHRSQTNPTFVNNEVVTEPILLKAGDIVAFGHQKLRFELTLPEGVEGSFLNAPEPSAQDSTQESPQEHPPKDDEESTGELPASESSEEPETGPITLPTQDSSSETVGEESPTPAPASTPVDVQGQSVEGDAPLSVAFKIRGQEFSGSAKSSVSARFSPDYKSTNGPVPFGEDVYFEIPARLKAEVQFQLDPATNQVTLSVEGSRVTTNRITHTDHLTLDVPIQGFGKLPLDSLDRVTHQGAEFWLPSEGSDSSQSADSDNGAGTLELDKEAFESLKDRAHRGMLEFQTGDWKGASITIFPGKDKTFDVGPGVRIGPYELPLQECPTCRISFDDKKPQVEVVEAADGQYVSVNGELLFACQANPLISGSGLFLGKYMLHWTQPEIQAKLAKYRLKFESNNLPISRALVRIGTASHCELLIDGQGLSPVTGTLECTHEGFFYSHLDSAIPAQIDGEMVMKGETAKLKSGSIIQLGLGSQLELEQRD